MDVYVVFFVENFSSDFKLIELLWSLASHHQDRLVCIVVGIKETLNKMCKLEYSRDTLIGLRQYASKNSLMALRKLGICKTATHRSRKLTLAGRNICIKFGLVNAQSVMKKQLLVNDHIVAHNLDLLAITEMWAPSNSQTCFSELLPNIYEVTHQARLLVEAEAQHSCTGKTLHVSS